jgi:hypothetical protein
MKHLVIPHIKLAQLPVMLGYAVLGAVVAGMYGVVHDQVTYSISTEYFTRLKFAQFHYANFGLPPRIFVAEIGFLATWWVGLFGAWFLARVTVPSMSRTDAWRHNLRGFAIMLGVAALGTFTGYLYGLGELGPLTQWQRLATALHIQDLPAFVRVAYIHNASYLGGLAGLIVALVYVRNRRNKLANRRGV